MSTQSSDPRSVFAPGLFAGKTAVVTSGGGRIGAANLNKRGFDELHREGEHGYPKMMSVGPHARWVGQAARVNALRQLIGYALDKGGVGFARRDEIPRQWVDHHHGWKR